MNGFRCGPAFGEREDEKEQAAAPPGPAGSLSARGGTYGARRQMRSARSRTAPAGCCNASATQVSRVTSCWAVVLVPTRSQIFRSLAFVLAGRLDGACTMRWQFSTRCTGLSARAALLVPPVAAGVVLAVDVVVDLPLLPQPTRDAPPRSATTRPVDSFRIDDLLPRGTAARRTAGCAAAILADRYR